MNVPAVLSASASVLDSDVVTFIVNGAKEVIGLMSTPPLGTFITIGIIGSCAGLVGTIVALCKGRH